MRNSRDIRVVRTQTALLEALEELIKKKKLSCITITDLCAQAKINRNTFYYHYNNIFEFLDEHKQIVIEDMYKVLEKTKIHSKQAHVELCKSLKRHPHYLNILISPNCDIDYSNDIFVTASKIISVLADSDAITNPRDQYICAYCDAGANAVIRKWILGGMTESPEEIADIIWETSGKGPFPLLGLI